MLTLVTGATGLVGNNVVRMLLTRGERVRVLARASSDARPLVGLPVETVRGDLGDVEALQRACDGAARVVHAAARVHLGWSGLAESTRVNVDGTRNVAQAARGAGARLIYVSTVDALGLGTRESPGTEELPPAGSVPCPYVVTKRAAEVEVDREIAAGLDAVIVNPAFMLGPWDWKPSSGRMLLEVAKGRALLAPHGGNSFCDVRDVAWGILAAAEQGQVGRRYILSGESMTYLEAWRMFAKVTGARRPWANAGPLMLIAAGKLGDWKHRLTGREPDVNSAAIRMARLPHYYSSARAEAELGYKPRPAEEAAAAAWDWFQANGYA